METKPQTRDLNGRQDFQRQILEYSNALYGMAFSLTRNRADAEDLVQEASIKAFRAYASFQPGTNFRAWIFTILRNAFINEYRRRKSRPESVSLDAEDGFSYYAQAGAAVEMGNNTAERLLDPRRAGEYFGDEIMHALQALPEEYREVIFLSDVQDLTYAETSQVLSVPVGTVRSRLSRGRSALQKSLWNYVNKNKLLEKEKS